MFERIVDDTTRQATALDGVPKEFICYLTKKIMDEPTIAADHHTYERAAIVKYLETSMLSPITGALLRNKTLFSNYALKGLIDDHKKKQKSTHEETNKIITDMQEQMTGLRREIQLLRSQQTHMAAPKVLSSNSRFFQFINSHSISPEKRIQLQHALVLACQEYHFIKVTDLMRQGAEFCQVDSDEVPALAIAFWSMHPKIVKVALQQRGITRESINNAMLYNSTQYGNPFPEFKPLNELTVREIADDYLSTQGRQIIFSDYIARKTSFNPLCWQKIEKSDATMLIQTHMVSWKAKINDEKVIAQLKSQSNNQVGWSALMQQYQVCSAAKDKVIEYINCKLAELTELEQNSQVVSNLNGVTPSLI
jgi:hypothetical protein